MVNCTVYSNSYGVGIALQSSKYYCMINFTTTDPATLAIAGIILFVLAFNYVFIVYAYSCIISVFKASPRKKGNKRENASSERLLIEKAVAFSAAYMVCWFPYILKIIFEMATKEPVSFEYDCICDLAGCTNPLLNVIVLIKYDARVKQDVQELFNVFKFSKVARKKESSNQKNVLKLLALPRYAKHAVSNCSADSKMANNVNDLDDTRMIAINSHQLADTVEIE